MDDVCNELVNFLRLSTRLELKLVATKNVLCLTGSPDGRKYILENSGLLEAILRLTKDENTLAAEDCYLSLVNISTEDKAVNCLRKYDIFPEFFQVICDPDSSFADHACMIVSNLTRSETGSKWCIEVLTDGKSKSISDLALVYGNKQYNTKKCKLDYLGSLFVNLTQIPEGRAPLYGNRRTSCLWTILQFSFPHKCESIIRRGAHASVMRNLCFDFEMHDWLIKEGEILPEILLPLAGPEEFEEEEMDKLLMELQYMPDDKEREPDQDIRKLYIESLLLLCANESSKAYLKSCNTQLIIKELCEWELANGVQEMVVECKKLLRIINDVDDNEDE